MTTKQDGLNTKSTKPEHFTDPVTLDIMTDPYQLTCGHTFDLSTLENLFKVSATAECPLCKTKVSAKNISRNITLKNIIDESGVIDPTKTNKPLSKQNNILNNLMNNNAIAADLILPIKVDEQNAFIERYSNNAIKSQTQKMNGIRHGNHRTFYESGAKKVHATYFNGNLQGSYYEYYESGNPMLKATYHNHQLNGEYIKYFDNNDHTIMTKANYRFGYKLEKYIEYHENGNKACEEEWKLYEIKADRNRGYSSDQYYNRRENFSYKWNEDKNLIEVKYYDPNLDSHKHSPYHEKLIHNFLAYIEYYPSGKLKVSTMMDANDTTNMIMHGSYIEYNEDGTIKCRKTYDKGKLIAGELGQQIQKPVETKKGFLASLIG